MMKCKVCRGLGKTMGGNMPMEECIECNGSGIMVDDFEKPIIDKSSKHYKTAIKKIRSLDEKITLKEAEDIFDKEYSNL